MTTRLPVFPGRARATIDLAALTSNFRLARQCAPDSRFVAVIKANAYGHGLKQAAGALNEAECFGVTDLREAGQLRSASDKPILILQGLITAEDLEGVAELDLQLVVQSLDQLSLINDRFRKSPPPSPLTFWLKMDSGMGRLGIAPEHYASAYADLAQQPYTRQVIMMTHLANASLPDNPLTAQQLDAFSKATTDMDGTTSIASSAGLLGGEAFRSDWARPGIMLYGSSPFGWEQEPLRADTLGLKPVMTLEARLIAIKSMQAGDNVGYCSQFICPWAMTVGIVSIGYADGYPSNAPNGTPVLVAGKRCETLGRVSMDMLAVDLSHVPDAKPGDSVTLWGKGLAVDEVANSTGILSYNLLCSVNARVEFTYHNDDLT